MQLSRGVECFSESLWVYFGRHEPAGLPSLVRLSTPDEGMLVGSSGRNAPHEILITLYLEKNGVLYECWHVERCWLTER